MYKKSEYRLIISQNLSSNLNSNIDKKLFKEFKKDDLPIFRVYSWQRSISFGAGQDPNDYQNLLKKYENNYSKRATGGGVLFHGHDISYSLVIPSSFVKEKSVKANYEKICSFLLKFYENLGLKASFAKDLENIVLSKNPYCQVGFEAYDIIINGKKIGGNAQKISKDVILQHGSIPLKTVSKDEAFGTSLEDFKIDLDFETASKMLIDAFKSTFNAQFKKYEIDIKDFENI
jgi:lipoyl(octanoyl) transferase